MSLKVPLVMSFKTIIVIGLYSLFVSAKNLKSLSCSPSSPEVCGPNASCFEEDPFDDSNELSHCECDSSAHGLPPNCKLECKDDCKPDEYCDVAQKLCVKKCLEDEDCGVDEYCRLYDGSCMKGCRSHKSCNDNELCDPHEKVCKIGCRGDNFCKTDEYCDFFTNTCLKGCRDDESCNEDEYCDSFNDRLCKRGCREWPGNCEKGEFCNSDSRECDKGCEHDIHCESNEICNLSNKKCYSYCYDSPCGNNSVCTIVDNNRHCSCMTGYSPSTGIGCKHNLENGSLIGTSAETLDCHKYCGHQSMCAVENNKITCYCLEDNGNNPFIDCSFLPAPPAPIGPSTCATLCG